MRKVLLSGVLALLGLAATAAPVLTSTVPAAPAAAAAPAHPAVGMYHMPIIGKKLLPGLGALLGGGRDGLRRATAVSSANWSGYADVNETYKSVAATWTEPTVNCSSGLGGLGGLGLGSLSDSLLGGPSAAAAFWVGLDGFNSTSVEQLGTDSDCDGSTASYYAWYEMYPNPSVDLSQTVNPGDSMTAWVAYTGSAFQLSITDNTQGWNFTTTEAGTFDRSSAEVVAEAPSECNVLFCSETNLADFGQVNFTGSTVYTDSSGPGGLSAYPADQITMADSGGTPLATPSALTDNGADFSIAWNNAS
jgi:hypothetical protein